jgi:hypothetical protein
MAYWMTVRSDGECTGCGKPVKRGSRAFYFPNSTSLYGKHCGCGDREQAAITPSFKSGVMLGIIPVTFAGRVAVIAKVKSAAVATAIFLACASPFVLLQWLTATPAPTPFATVQQCKSALGKWQYDNGHHDEKCVELQDGGWCVYAPPGDYDSLGAGHCIGWASTR